jgi:hypothetical protein
MFNVISLFKSKSIFQIYAARKIGTDALAGKALTYD